MGALRSHSHKTLGVLERLSIDGTPVTIQPGETPTAPYIGDPILPTEAQTDTEDGDAGQAGNGQRVIQPNIYDPSATPATPLPSSWQPGDLEVDLGSGGEDIFSALNFNPDQITAIPNPFETPILTTNPEIDLGNITLPGQGTGTGQGQQPTFAPTQIRASGALEGSPNIEAREDLGDNTNNTPSGGNDGPETIIRSQTEDGTVEINITAGTVRVDGTETVNTTQTAVIGAGQGVGPAITYRVNGNFPLVTGWL